MAKQKDEIDVTLHRGSGNVFADLGFSNPEELQVKSSMVQEIDKAIKNRGLTQSAAANLVGIDQPTLSKLLNGHFHRISLDRLIEILNRLGRNVEIRVRPARGKATAKTSFVTM
jgi:predicted XRE-type DNA-binding protein